MRLTFLRLEVIDLGENNSITFSKDTAYGIIIAVLTCLLVISVFTQGFGLVKSAVPMNQSPGNQTATQPSANQTAPTAVKTLELPPSLDLAPVMGPANSKITLLEFSDFQCPYCGMAFGSPWTKSPQYSSDVIQSIVGTIPEFEANYVDTGKADFRHFPVAFLGIQEGVNESLDAADAALCANAQGRYFQMYDALFNAQTPNEGDGKYSKPNLEIIAQNVSGLNQSEFDACLAANTYVDQVGEFTNDWETADEANSGSASTPTLWLLVNASQTTQAQVSAAAVSFDWGLTSDNSTYVIIVTYPDYNKIPQVMSALE
jgi:protein-disulfide isomerase